MKVCIVGDNLNPKAGWGRMISAIGGELGKRGFKVGYVLNQKAPSGLKEPSLHVPFFIFGLLYLAALPVVVLKVRRFIRKYDIIHIIDVYPYSIIATLANIGLKKPVVLHCLGTYSLMPEGGGLVKRLARWAVKKADYIFSVSDFSLKQMRASGLDPKNPEVLPVGVDVKKFKTAKHERPISAPYVLCVGAIKPRKGIKELIDGFSLIKNPDLKLVIIGARDMSNYSKIVDNFIEEKNLKDRVIIKEGLSDEDLMSYYNHCEFFCLLPITSKRAFEGFGLVYLEAAMMDKTSIGALNSGAEAAIINNETGLLVNAKHEEEIAKTMKKLFDDTEFRTRLEKHAKEFALKHSWRNIVDRIEAAYKMLTSPSRTTN